MGGVIAVATATVLLTAAGSKAARFSYTSQLWSRHGVLPRSLTPLLVGVVTFIEALVGALLLFPSFMRGSSAAATVLFLAFSTYLWMAIRRGTTTSCACFAFDTAPLNVAHVMRAVVLALVASVGVVTGPTAVSPSALLVGLSFALSLILVTSLLARVLTIERRLGV